MMRIIKNQAVVALLLLGYYVITLFFLYDKFFYIFDLIAMQLPLSYSDFVGLANQNLVFLHRGFYLSAGLLLIILATLFFDRLPQSRPVRILSATLAGFLLIVSLFCVYFYLQINFEKQEYRANLIKINQQYVNQPNVTPLKCDIGLTHNGDEIQSVTRYAIINNTENPLDHFYFSLNPGLSVSDIRSTSGEVEFTQTEHIINISPATPLSPGVTDTVTFLYGGTIKDAICFLEVDSIQRDAPFTVWLYRIPKKHSFLTTNYVLLPAESLWYPKAGLPAGSGFPQKMEKHFIDYQLNITTYEHLTAISQGEMTSDTPGQFYFEPEYPLSNISLVIGAYWKQSITVDSIEVNLFTIPDHNYYEAYFNEIGDTLTNVISELRQDYEVKLNLEYPFNRFSIIEVPLQYYVYPRLWTLAQEVAPPEQIWIQENGASIRATDLHRINNSMERRIERANQTYSDVEYQITMFKNMINPLFLGHSIPGFFFGGPSIDYQPDYNIFPNFYSHITFVNAEEQQIFNTALESFLYERVAAKQNNSFSWYQRGLTDAELVSQSLKSKSLAELFLSHEKDLNFAAIIKQKGAYIFKLMQNELNSETFDNGVSQIIRENRFKNIDLPEFISALNLEDKLDIVSYLNEWYHNKILPAFFVSNVEIYKVLDSDRIRSQVKFNIYNPETIDGLIDVSFQYGRRGRGMPFGMSGDDEPPRVYKIKSQQTLQIGILLDEEPRSLNVDFLIAKNLPLVYTKRFDDVELDENKTPFDGVRTIENFSGWQEENELIVDNEDSGFRVQNPAFGSILKQMIHSDSTAQDAPEYDRFQWWSPPFQWTPIKNAAFYGEYIHTAYYTRSGSGNKFVTWKTNIDKNGVYDIYTFIFSKEGLWRGRRRGGNVNFGDYNYNVYHDGGVETITIPTNNTGEGWIFLGSWFLSAGEAKVVLTDESDGGIVIADAIKWVKN